MQPELHSVLARINAVDAALCVRINRVNRSRLAQIVFGGASRLGDGVFWYGLMALLLMVEHEAALKPVLHMIVAGLLGLALYKWLKHKTLRPRPCDLHPAILRGTAPLDEFSFPSGHTLHAVTFTVVALAYYPALAPLLVPFTLLVALSRVILGLHYPSDVLAGAAIGYVLAMLSLLF
ncbi:MAG: phosphatase PAP2 family protein [Burkholderiales bacterium]